jgi:hypothetical protein
VSLARSGHGHTIKILHIIDKFARESVADVVAYSIDADATVAVASQRRCKRRLTRVPVGHVTRRL